MVSSTSQGFGKVVHAIAERMATGDIDADADLMALVDEVWGRMEFRTPWSAPASAQAVARRAHPLRRLAHAGRAPAPCSPPSRRSAPR